MMSRPLRLRLITRAVRCNPTGWSRTTAGVGERQCENEGVKAGKKRAAAVRPLPVSRGYQPE